MTHIKVKKLWGEEEWLVNTHAYAGKLLILNHPSVRSSLHYHKIKDETFYVASGTVTFELGWSDNRQTIKLTPGMSIRVLPNTPHRFGSRTTARIYEFSTYHDEQDVYRLEESGPW